MTNPLAKKNGFYTEKVADEVIVYDKATHRAHFLNKTAAAVWENADGSRSVEDLASVLESQFRIPKDRDVVLLALQQLETAGLLEAEVAENAEKPSRRQMSKKLAMVGASASLVPVIASVLAPTPAMASSPGAGVSMQKYIQDLKTVKTEIKGQKISGTLKSDYHAGKKVGDKGIILEALGNTKGAQKDFQVAENDFNGVLNALGLPRL